MARMTTGKDSQQTVYTPPNLIWAVNEYWPLEWDLASTGKSALQWIDPLYRNRYFGPGSLFHDDAFYYDWSEISEEEGWLWLNPPYKDIGPWYERCQVECQLGARIVSLVNYDTAKWMTCHVPGHADIIDVGRLTFCDIKGDPIKRFSEKTGKWYSASNPKNSVLHIWRGPELGPTRYAVWDWKRDKWIVGRPWCGKKVKKEGE